MKIYVNNIEKGSNFEYSVSMIDKARYFLIKQCAICGSLLCTELLCAVCFENIKNYFFNQPLVYRVDENDISIISFVAWNKENDFIIRPLVYNLKEGSFKEIYEKLCWLFVLKLKKDGVLNNNQHYKLVPIPGKKGVEKDHAFEVALNIARLINGEVIHRWKKPLNLENQKNKNKRLRKKIYFERIDPRQTEDSENFMYLIIDDVVTTGSSFIAAKKILDKKCVSICLSLFDRPLEK